MLDYSMTIAPYWHEAQKQARTVEAEQHVWVGRLRELERAERRTPGRRQHTVVISKPESLAGVHKIWI